MAGQCGEKVEGETTMDDALIPLKHQDEIFKLRKKPMLQPKMQGSRSSRMPIPAWRTIPSLH
jgi:hypothetical protein